MERIRALYPKSLSNIQKQSLGPPTKCLEDSHNDCTGKIVIVNDKIVRQLLKEKEVSLIKM